MKILMLAVALITLYSCHNTSTDNNKSRELIPSPEGSQKDTFAQPAKDSAKPIGKNETADKYFPFKLSEMDGKYSISVEIEGGKLYDKYYKVFKKYGYEGNGPCWEGHIKQILEKKDKNLLSHIEFDSEAGGFFAYADSKETQEKFVEIVSPIFSNLNILSDWVRTADRSQIDD